MLCLFKVQHDRAVTIKALQSYKKRVHWRLLVSFINKPVCWVIFLILKVLEDSRQILVAANMQPDDPFPMDDKIKEGLDSLLHLSSLALLT